MCEWFTYVIDSRRAVEVIVYNDVYRLQDKGGGGAFLLLSNVLDTKGGGVGGGIPRLGTF